MSRYIDADELIVIGLDDPDCEHQFKFVPWEFIEDAPTVDVPQWIPCSERLPEDDGEYLVWMQWDFEEEPSYSIVNYDANVEAFGEWHEYFDKYTLGSLGSDFEEIKGVIAWMPLPEPWKGEEDD